MVVGRGRESKDDSFGSDAETGDFTDLVKAGVIDPAKVNGLALQNAASVAGLMLSTEALVVDIEEDGKKAAVGATGAAVSAGCTRPAKLLAVPARHLGRARITHGKLHPPWACRNAFV